MRFKPLALVVLASSFSFGVCASPVESSLDVDFYYELDQGSYPCVVIESPVIDFGSIDGVGRFDVDATLTVECDSTDSKFFMWFDESGTTTGTDVYSDQFVTIWAGSRSSTQDGINMRRFLAPSFTGCSLDTGNFTTTDSISADGITLYPIGGEIKTHRGNGSICMSLDTTNETGVYTATITGVIQVHQMPDDEQAEDIPTSFVLPLNLVHMVEREVGNE